jgi:hypothetical protein
MNPEINPDKEPFTCPSAQTPEAQSLSPAEQEQLSDAATQEEYRREYLAQLRRRACPGCGESDDPLI